MEENGRIKVIFDTKDITKKLRESTSFSKLGK
jgi:hypothetical protein